MPSGLLSGRLSTNRLSTKRSLQLIEEIDFSEYQEVLLHVALCHSVIYDKRTGKMNSASPDELALVKGAKVQGFSFEGKDPLGVISVFRASDKALLKFEHLNSLEFDSTRKRMSVILRDLQKNQLVLLSKGADSVMKQRLNMADLETATFMRTT